MAELFAGLLALSARAGLRRAALSVAPPLEMGHRPATGKRTVRKMGDRPRPGKPRTGVLPKTGVAAIDPGVEDRKRRPPVLVGGGGRGAGLSPVRRTVLPAVPMEIGLPPALRPRSDAVMKRALASGSQASVVKLASYAGGSTRMGALMNYQSHDGELALEREDGSKVEGKEKIAALARSWAEESHDREPSKDVHRFSMRLGVERSTGEIETALGAALAGHRYAWRVENGADGQVVHVVTSAASDRKDEHGRRQRIFDNRKSLAAFGVRLEKAFGCDPGYEGEGFAHGIEGAARYLSRLTKGGQLPARTEKGTVLDGHAANLDEAKSWKRDLRSREKRDVAHIILSAKPGTDLAAFTDAARAMLAAEFSGHEYAFALHTNRRHIHVHAVVRMASVSGERLDPKITDFHRWRARLAETARERHIQMEAPRRFDRANPPGYKLRDIRCVERGVASDSARRRIEAVRNNAIHVPTRPEGRKRAASVAGQWRDLDRAARGHQVAEPALADGTMRYYRADRPGATLTSAPLFTTVRADAEAMARQSGGLVSYVDVPTNRSGEVRRARSGPESLFVLSPGLAAGRQVLSGMKNTDIDTFRQRAETAAAQSQSYQAQSYRASPSEGAGKGQADPMGLETMLASFDEIDAQFRAIRKVLPEEHVGEFDRALSVYGKERDLTVRAQEKTEKLRGAVEGDGYVRPERHEFARYTGETVGETVRYSHVSGDGVVGKVAFIDSGARVDIHDWKDRETVLSAMQVSAQKWGVLTVTGSDRYKRMVVELAVEHRFEIANPELQDQLQKARERMQVQRDRREGFVAAPPMMKPADAERPAAGKERAVPPVAVAGQGRQPVMASPSSPATEASTSREPVAAEHAAGQELRKAEKPAIVDTGTKIEIRDWKDRETVLEAMRASSEKWGALKVTGSERQKRMAVELAAEHGFEIANPELQEQLQKARERIQVQRDRQPGFAAAASAEVQSQGPDRNIPASSEPLRTDGERAIALETIRKNVDTEAQRESRQARATSSTGERPFDGGGEDHAYRTQTQAAAARRADRAAESTPGKPIPAEINQSPEIERLRQQQGEVLKEAAKAGDGAKPKEAEKEKHKERSRRQRPR